MVGRPNLTEVTPIRFSAALEAAAQSAAASEGMKVGEWIRKIVNQEIARREGRCAACGQMLPGEEENARAAV